MPQRLTATQVKEGINAVKSRAQACGPKHGAMPGYKVVVKMTLKGATGRVSTSKPVRSDADTELGRCVAKALGKARFPRFHNSTMTVQYPILF